MRMGQNKRMRGRSNNNNNRKGPNPLTRSYESNGPDVKIRGTPHHVAEKYLQLARDAQTSGDPVMAESYLQHAEHYFRIIAAAQLQQAQAQAGYVRPPGEPEADESEDDDDIGGLPDRFASPVERQPPPPAFPQPQPPQPAPFQNRQPYNGERQGGDRFNQDRFGQERQGQERVQRQDRRYPDRNDRDNRPDRQGRDFRPRDQFRNATDPQAQPQPITDRESRAPAAEQAAGAPILPAFITAPVRGSVVQDADMSSPPDPATPFSADASDDGGQYHLRSRRRRRGRPGLDESDPSSEHGEAPVTPLAD